MRFRFAYILPLLVYLVSIVPGLQMEPGDVNVRENRSRESWPSWGDVSVGSWSSVCRKFEVAFADRFWGRDVLVQAHARLMNLFCTDGNERVLLGREGWMFLRDTLSAYGNEERYACDQKERIRDYLAGIAEYCCRRGKIFAVLIVPDKCRIYPEHVTCYLKVHSDDESRTEDIAEFLQSAGIPVSYPRKELLKVKESLKSDLYYRHDTHWTPYGAWEGGYLPLVRLLRGQGPCGRTLNEPSWVSMSADGHCDLETMIPFGPHDGMEYLNSKMSGLISVAGDRHLKILTSEEGAGRAYMLRDSFALALIPYLGRTFQTCVLRKGTRIPNEDMPMVMCSDVVIVEICERNLGRLSMNRMELPVEMRR